MSNELAHLPQAFREKLVDQVLGSFMGMLPKEKVDEMIAKEVMAFFETEQVLTVEETRIEVPNPMYKSSDRWAEPKKKVDALVFGAAMTPFRQLVWSCMHQHLTPIVNDAIIASAAAHTEALADWLVVTVQQPIDAAGKINVESQLTKAASVMMATVHGSAVQNAHENLRMAFNSVGVSTDRLPNSPVMFYSPKP